MTKGFRYCIICLAFQFAGIAAIGTVAAATKHDVSVANLYLMRNLEHTLNTWKSPSGRPEELGIWVFDTRNRLICLKKAAELYKLDDGVIGAYDDMLNLLQDYEEFLRDIVLVDLVANVARPEQQSLFTGLARGAIQLGYSGMYVGTFTPFPIVGPIVGGLGAAAVGGAAAFYEYEGALSKNDSINSHVTQSQRQLIDRVAKHFASTTKGLETVAKILGGEAVNGWGTKVGFDGSGRLSNEEQLRRRPTDAFLHATIGIQLSASNPESAAEWLAKAAALVPQDFDSGVDIFDKDRAEFLFTAARVVEYDARREGAAALAASSIRYYLAAKNCLQEGDNDIPQELQLVYARACAISGRSSEAERVMTALLQRSQNSPSLLYENAGVMSQLGDYDSALKYLRESFNSQPRWQPAALLDTRLTRLRNAFETEFESICNNPLIGTWSTANHVTTLTFYLDGSFHQRNGLEEKNGTFEQLDGKKLRLKTTDKEATYTYNVATSTLSLGDTFKFDRNPRPLIGTWNSGNQFLEFREDGTWRKNADNTRTSGTYAVLAPPRRGADHELIVSNESIVLGNVDRKFAFNVNDNRLIVKIAGDPTEYEYKRAQ